MIAMSNLRRVLVVGGSFTGFCVSCDMQNKFLVTIVMPILRRVLVAGGSFAYFVWLVT